MAISKLDLLHAIRYASEDTFGGEMTPTQALARSRRFNPEIPDTEAAVKVVEAGAKFYWDSEEWRAAFEPVWQQCQAAGQAATGAG